VSEGTAKGLPIRMSEISVDPVKLTPHLSLRDDPSLTGRLEVRQVVRPGDRQIPQLPACTDLILCFFWLFWLVLCLPFLPSHRLDVGLELVILGSVLRICGPNWSTTLAIASFSPQNSVRREQ
jgi:hypothetical protein